MLAQQSGAIGGFLYANQDGGLALSALTGDVELDPEIELIAHHYFQGETADHDVTQSLTNPDPTPNAINECREVRAHSVTCRS